MARTNYEMDEALEKLMKKGIKRIKISPDPVTPANRRAEGEVD
jgi:hypothetical protein